MVKIENPSAVEAIGCGVCSCFCLLPNGDFVVAQQQTLSLWGSAGDTCIRSFRGHSMPVLALASNISGELIASGSTDGSIRVWDTHRGFCTHNFKENGGIVRCVQFHPVSFQVFSICADNCIRVHDLCSKETVKTFRSHTAMPAKLEFHHTTNSMVSAGKDKV